MEKLLYIPRILRKKLISRHHNKLIVGYFRIEKAEELVAQKYYWKTLKVNVKSYVKRCNICSAFKMVCYKFYKYLPLFSVPRHHRKKLSRDFVISLLISTNEKSETYNSILVIVDWPTKIVYNELVKMIIDVSGHVKVIFNIIICHHGWSNSIMSDCHSVFTLRFSSSLCYFYKIKQMLSIVFCS